MCFIVSYNHTHSDLKELYSQRIVLHSHGFRQMVDGQHLLDSAGKPNKTVQK